ncbi:MAG: DUF4115 domain-containing protein [Synergistaceae bacterium]|nr:DUF4115 domain-containing protein [Synergistaceae bacterium]
MTENDDALVVLGQTLTERREAIGMTLETVFDRTKIRPEYLRGIENGNYEGFPETVYIKGFVRTYLKLIDAEDMQEEFMSQLDRLDRKQVPGKKQEPRQPKNMKNILGNGSSIPKGFKPASHFWLFLVLVAALLGTGGYVWYAVNYAGLDLRNLKLFNFSGTTSPVSAISTASGDVIADINGEAVSVTVSDDESQDEEPEQPVSPSLEIRAVNDVWLSVAFGNAQPVFRRTLRRGDSVRWDLNAPARVVFGRPSAAQVVLNGQDLGVVNPSAKRSETYIYNSDGTFRRSGRN